jgi:hypothetical protein
LIDDDETGYRYKITVELDQNNLDDDKYHTNLSDSSVVNTVPLTHDVWNRKALGKSGWEIYDFLVRILPEKVTANTISKKTGRAPSTVRAALRKLQAVGLVYRDVSFWIASVATPERLDEIAEKFGTRGAGELIKERHSQERAWHAARQFPKFSPDALASDTQQSDTSLLISPSQEFFSLKTSDTESCQISTLESVENA